jgi:hypothetical protein
MDIHIIKDRITFVRLNEIAEGNYGNMVKGVIDVQLKIIALGGELHADAEAVLIREGSQQEHLWGFNIYPDKSDDERIEYTSLINIRPSQKNLSLEVQNAELRAEIRQIIDSMIQGKNG